MLTSSFFQRDVLTVAKELIGKTLCSNIGGKITKGMITETEAYSYCEKGCHGYQNKKTKRNAPMFEAGGISYIYICYGMHHLLNIVTGKKELCEAVLIRALQPVFGIEEMKKRRKKAKGIELTCGPGKLTQAMGLSKRDSGLSFMGNKMWVEEATPISVYSSTRIGIEYAGKDAELPWRFIAKNNKWVSRL